MVITTSSGYEALIDDEDWDKIKDFAWHINKRGTNLYVVSSKFKNGKRENYKLHRLLLSAPPGMQVDHIDGNSLNNHKSNLRLCTNQQNTCNSKKSFAGNPSSQYKGVCFYKKHKKWKSQIMFNYKQINLGLFSTELEAAIAYNNAAVRLHGEFARINKL